MTTGIAAVLAALDAPRVLAHCDALGRLSEMEGGLTRVFLSPQQRAANSARARLDARGRHGRAASTRSATASAATKAIAPDLPCLMLGSHLDTVRDAGKYDGMLGVLSAIECVARAAAPRPCVCRSPSRSIGFGDEEGVRYGSTLLGSRAVAGTFDRRAARQGRRDGITMRDALRRVRPRSRRALPSIGAQARPTCSPTRSCTSSRDRCSKPKACPSAWSPRSTAAIASRSRSRGMAGHAGTVPMSLRRDALAAAAECVLAVERIARVDAGARRHRRPHRGAARRDERDPRQRVVLARRARADRRASGTTAVAAMRDEFDAIAARRRVELSTSLVWDAKTAPCCAPRCSEQFARAIAAEGIAVHQLAVRRRARRHGDHRHRADRHAVRALQGRHQPQSGARPITPDDVATGLRVFAALHRRRSRRRRPDRRADRTNVPRVRISATQRSVPRGARARARRTIRPAIARRTRQRAAQLLEAMGFAVERHVVPPTRGARQRHGELHQPRRARALRRTGPVDRAQRARRRRAAGTRLDRRSVWRRSARRRHVRPRRRRVEVGFRDLRVRAARAAWPRRRAGARFAGTVELHFTYDEEVGGSIGPGWLLRRRSAQPDYAISAGFSYGITTAHNGCLHLEVEVIGKSGHAAEPEKGIDALEAATGILADLYALAQVVRARFARAFRASRSPDAGRRSHQRRHQHQRRARQRRLPPRPADHPRGESPPRSKRKLQLRHRSVGAQVAGA